MIPSAGLHTEQLLGYSPTASGPLWSNSFIVGYPWAYARDDAALRLLSAHSVPKPRPYITCTATRPVVPGVSSFSLNCSGSLKTPTLYTSYAAPSQTVSSACLTPAHRMILIALILLFKSAGSKFSKATYQTSAKVQSTTRRAAQANSGQNNFLCVSRCTAIPLGKLGVQLHTYLKKTAQTTPALALDRRYKLTIGASSMSYWRKDSNHEPLNCLRGLRRIRPCSPSSIKASGTLAPNYTPVIKTSALISPKQPWPQH
jgi:hypothetical protein